MIYMKFQDILAQTANATRFSAVTFEPEPDI